MWLVAVVLGGICAVIGLAILMGLGYVSLVIIGLAGCTILHYFPEQLKEVVMIGFFVTAYLYLGCLILVGIPMCIYDFIKCSYRRYTHV